MTDPFVFWALTVKLNDPLTVGVPLMTPVVLFNVSPVGSAPAVTVSVGDGVPVAVIILEYGVLRFTAGRDVVVIVGGGATSKPVQLPFSIDPDEL